MEQLDKWNKEMRRLSVAKFAETDDALYNYYKEALKSLKVEIKQYVENYDQLSFSKRLEVDNRLKTANHIDGILNDLNSWSDAEIRRYIDSGEPMDKAGAYGIQGRAAAFIAHLAGSYSGVMGLPLHETVVLLKRFA